MFVTKILEGRKREEYVAFTHQVMEVEGEEVKLDIYSIGDKKHLKTLAEYRNLGPPLSLGLCSNIIILNREDLLSALSASGVKSEEIEKLKPKL
jgi:hypothetical protein